jgi:hypothetical protein
VPLIAGVLVLLVGAGVGAYLWLQDPATKVARGPVATPPPATPLPASIATPVAVATPAGGKATPTPVATHAAPDASATATPTPAATPVALALATAPPVSAATPTPAPKLEATPTPAAATPPPPVAAAPAEPATLSAISPLALKRGQTTILDVHGANLRADLQLHIAKAKGGGSASGFGIAKQQFFDSTLLKILVKVDVGAEAGVYLASLVDSQGSATNGLPITITK